MVRLATHHARRYGSGTHFYSFSQCGVLLGREDGTDESHEGSQDREARAEYVRTYLPPILHLADLLFKIVFTHPPNNQNPMCYYPPPSPPPWEPGVV